MIVLTYLTRNISHPAVSPTSSAPLVPRIIVGYNTALSPRNTVFNPLGYNYGELEGPGISLYQGPTKISLTSLTGKNAGPPKFA